MIDQLMQASAQQERFWLNWKLNPSSPSLNVSLRLGLTGKLNISALNQTLQTVFNNYYPAARFSFVQEPNQQLKVKLGPELKKFELVAKPVNGDLTRHIQEFASKAFDLEKGPLYRFLLVKVDEKNHVLVAVFHHIIIDAHTITLLLSIMQKLYNGYATNNPQVVLKKHYFAKQASNTSNEEHLAFWLKELAKAEFKINFDVAHKELTEESCALDLSLSRELMGLVNARYVTCQETAFVVFSAVLFVLLTRLTQQTNLCISYPVSLREENNRYELDCYINNLPLHALVSDQFSFNQLAAMVKQKRKQAKDHQSLSLLEIIKALRAKSQINDEDFLNVEISSSFVKPTVLRFKDLEVSYNYISLVPDKSLRLFFDARDNNCQLRFEYQPHLGSEFINRFAQYYCNLLEACLKAPEQKLNSIEFMPTWEKQLILQRWNNTFRPYNLQQSLSVLFERQVAEIPDHLALKYLDIELSYAELNQCINRLAHKIILHIPFRENNPLIALCVERGIEMVVAIYAILKLGGAYLPIDPTWPKARKAAVLTYSQASLVLVQPKFYDQFNDMPFNSLELVADYPNFSAENLPALERPHDLSYILYTSGSTGKPKGVMIEQRSVLNRLLWMQETYPLKMNDVVAQKTPFSFDVSVWEFFWPLLNGATLAILPPDSHKDPHLLTDFIHKNKVSILHFVPSMLRLWLNYAEIDASFSKNISSVRQIFVSGEAFTPDLLKLTERFLNIPIHNLYGPTETTVDVTAWSCENQISSNAYSLPIGKPIANTAAYILDRHLQLVPMGIKGELYIGGVGVARGYLNQEELTRQKFIANPFVLKDTSSIDPNPRLYATGDLARWREDGNIDYLGRIDSQIKLHGLRIELGEIEAVLHTLHPAAAWVVVLKEIAQIPHLVAYYVSTQSFSSQQLRQELNQHLAYYMIPNYFMQLDNFPITENGKLNRSALPLPDESNFMKENSADQSKWSKTQQLLVQIWSEVLHKTQLMLTSNFFSLGGNSIDCIHIVLELQKRNIAITPKILFDYPTIIDLAKWIDTQAQAIRDQIHPNSFSVENGHYPLSPMQEVMIHYYENNQNPAVYHFQQCFWLNKFNYSLSTLEVALNRLVSENPNLRLAFEPEKGLLKQRVEDKREYKIHFQDLRSLPAEEQTSFIEKFALSDRKRRFKLLENDLLRLHVFQLREDSYALFISQHHAITDGWSNQLFLHQWFSYSHSLHEYRFVETKANVNAYPAYVNSQMSYSADKKLQNYWRQEIGRLHSTPHYATQQKINSEKMISPFTSTHILESDLTKRLVRLAAQYAVSLRALLLHCFLSAFRKVDELSAHLNIGLLVNGREASLRNALHTTGLFWNLVPWTKEVIHSNNREALQAVQQHLNVIDAEKGRFPYAALEKMLRENAKDLFAIFNFTEFGFQPENYGFQLADYKVADLYHFPLNFHVNYSPEHLSFCGNYSHHHLSQAQIDRLYNGYQQELAQCVQSVT